MLELGKDMRTQGTYIQGSLCWYDYHVSAIVIATLPIDRTSAITIAVVVPFYHIFPPHCRYFNHSVYTF
jgi:hypothetical protein